MPNPDMPRKGRILVVDDDRVITQLIATYFESHGYEVIKAWNGREALGMVEGLAPDLVILDVLMPVMSGLEVCATLRAGPKTATLPIIMLSALGEVNDKALGLRLGADEYVAKPVGLQELGARVEALLRHTGQAPPAQPGRRGKVIAFMGAKGGVGTTTVVLNIAAALTQQNKTALALEMHPAFGTFSQQLRLGPVENLSSLLGLEADRIGERVLRSRLCNAANGLSVLPGPQRVSEFRELAAGQAEAIVRQAALLADYVLIDLPCGPSAANAAITECSDLVILVLEPDPACISCARIAFDLLKSWRISPAQVGAVIVIQGRPASAWRPHDVRPQLGCEIVGVVTEAAEGLETAQEHALPLVVCLPGHLATSTLIETAKRLAAPALVGIRL